MVGTVTSQQEADDFTTAVLNPQNLSAGSTLCVGECMPGKLDK